MEEKVKKLIEEKVRPALQMDGGDIELVSVDGDEVKVRLKGACHGCPSAAMTLEMGVKRMLQNEIPEIKSVVSI